MSNTRPSNNRCQSTQLHARNIGILFFFCAKIIFQTNETRRKSLIDYKLLLRVAHKTLFKKYFQKLLNESVAESPESQFPVTFSVISQPSIKSFNSFLSYRKIWQISLRCQLSSRMISDTVRPPVKSQINFTRLVDQCFKTTRSKTTLKQITSTHLVNSSCLSVLQVAAGDFQLFPCSLYLIFLEKEKTNKYFCDFVLKGWALQTR